MVRPEHSVRVLYECCPWSLTPACSTLGSMRSIAFVTVLLLALLVSTSGQMTLAAHGRHAVRHTVVAASGSAAPAGGTYINFLNAALNARQEVAFDAFVAGPPPTTGVFVGDGKATSTIALGTNPDPAAS